MKHWQWTKRILCLLCVCALIAGVAAACVKTEDPPPDSGEDESEQGPAQLDYTFDHVKPEAEFLGGGSDVGKMILHCDDSSEFKSLTNATVTNRKGQYVEGTGAAKIGSLLNTATTYGYFEAVDISDYAEGSVHFSLYVSDPAFMKSDLYIELTSSGRFDAEELGWQVSPALLKAGWNDLYLGIADATLVGTPNLSAINFYRMYTNSASMGLEVSFDNVYATVTPGMDLTGGTISNTASAKPGYIMDCDSLSGVTSGSTLTTYPGEFMEGDGALAAENVSSVWLSAHIKPIDLKDSKNDLLTFWLYVNDAEYLKDGELYVELSSSHTYDRNEVTLRPQPSSLRTGWNEVVLNLGSAFNSSEEPIDWSNVNFVRFYSLKCDPRLTVILDGVRIVSPNRVVSKDGMLLSCDSTENLRITSKNEISVTKAANEHKQGSGALKSAGTASEWYMITMNDLVDISSYANGGLHLWLYVSDRAKLEGAVNIELSSGGKYDADELQWAVSGLQNGWNELMLDFDSAEVIGNPNLSGVNFFRIYTQVTGHVTVILDDVRAMNYPNKTQVPGVLLDCDDTIRMSVSSGAVFSITDKHGEFVEGTGAFKSAGNGQMRLQVKRNRSVDLSAYKQGGLTMSLYIGDRSAFASSWLQVEITSSKTCDKNELYWQIRLSGLKENAWNTVELPFASAGREGGEIDLANVNYFRIWCEKSEPNKNALIIVDDVRAYMPDPEDTIPPEPGLFTDCDSKRGLEGFGSGGSLVVTSEPGELYSGAGAFKNAGAGQLRFRLTRKVPVDWTAYKNGTLEFWLYVNDTSKVVSKWMNIEINSSGENDRNELYWQYQFANLKPGEWNHIVLKFPEGAKENGDIDFANVRYFRIWTEKEETDEGLTFIIDDIRAVEPVPEEIPPVLGPGVLTACDTTAGLTVGSECAFSVTQEPGEFTEGTGAFKTVGGGVMRYLIKTKTPVDWTEYKNGALDFWLYINDTSKVTSKWMNIEINSTGVNDQNELYWQYRFTDLKAGEWNHIVLNFSGAAKENGDIDFANVRYFRIWFEKSETDENLTVILDNIRAVSTPGKTNNPSAPAPSGPSLPPDVPSEVRAEFAGCDSMDGITVSSESTVTVTTQDGEVKEGNGALKSVGGGVLRYLIKTDTASNWSAYQEKGTLEFWLYVDDITKFPTGSSYMNVEINSSGVNDINELCWQYPVSSFKDGWNKIILKLSEGKPTGTIDLSKVRYFRIYFEKAITDPELTLILDDIRAVNPPELEPGVFTACDTTDGLNVTDSIAVTEVPAEVRAGTGAFKTDKGVFIIRSNNPVDLSAYESGSLEFWLNINDKSTIKASEMVVEINSSGVNDDNELQWIYQVNNLQNGWNRIVLNFSGGTPNPERGTIDFANIRYFRIYFNNAKDTTNDGLTMILDDVRAALPATPGALLGDSLEAITVLGDTEQGANEVTVVAEGEDAGAIKSAGTSTELYNLLLNRPVDLSECLTDGPAAVMARAVALTGKSGALRLSLNIDDTSKLGDTLYIEISSDGHRGFKGETHTYKWAIPVDSLLSSQWTNLELPFSRADYTKDGGADLRLVNWFHIYVEECNGEVTAMLDEVGGAEYTPVPAVPGIVISNCEDAAAVGSSVQVTTAEGEYTEGTGAYKSTGDFGISLKNPVDISANRIGALQMQLKISATDLPSQLHIELTSSGKPDEQELCWNISKEQLQQHVDGLTQLLLPFNQAAPTGTFDYTRANYMRFWFDGGAGVTLIVDDIRAVAVPETGEDGILISNLESGVTMGTSSQFTDREGEFVEGNGAQRSAESLGTRFHMTLEKPVDISAAEGGKLQFYLYVGDNTLTDEQDNLIIEMTSSGQADRNELYWELQLNELEKNAWNKVELDLTKANVGSDEPLDYTGVNFFRFYFTSAQDVTLILDDLRAVPPVEEPPVVEPVEPVESDVFATCDTTDGLTVSDSITVTDVSTEVRAGTGAFKSEGNATMRFLLKSETPLNWTKYKDTGTLEFWLYVNDTGLIHSTQNVNVEINSSGENDTNELFWQYSVANLANGWNRIVLELSKGAAEGGDIDFSRVCRFRIWLENATPDAGLVMILDDVRAALPMEPGVLLSGDSLDAVTVLGTNEVATDTDESKGGVIKSFGSSIELYKLLLDRPADLSEYAKGALHLWLNVSDKSGLGENLFVQISSDGNRGFAGETHTYKWKVPVNGLVNGWNELTLPFATAETSGDGAPNLHFVNWLYIYVTDSPSEVTALLCDVRGTEYTPPEPEPPADPVPGIVFSGCEDAAHLTGTGAAVTNAVNEFVEGKGAYKSTGEKMNGFGIKLTEPVNISANRLGGLQLKLHTSAALTKNLHVELNSSGTVNDNQELEWEINPSQVKPGEWTTVFMPFDAARATGEIEYTAVNYMRFYFVNGDNVTLIVDDIRAVVVPETREDDIVISNLESGVTVGTSSQFTDSEGEFVEGKGAYKSAGSLGTRFSLKLDETVDLTAAKGGKLQFYLYVGGETLTNDNLVIEMTSSGQADQNEIFWNLHLDTLVKNAWNKVTLDLTKANPGSAEPLEYAKVNYFRFYFTAAQDVTLILDDLRAIIPDTPPVEEEDDGTVKIIGFDSEENFKNGTGNSAITYDTGAVKTGTGALKSITNMNTPFLFTLETPVDISKNSTGALQFWLRIDDQFVYDLLHVEMSSSGKYDVEELEWKLDLRDTSAFRKYDDGGDWYLITLPFSYAQGAGGSIRFENINYFRFWFDKQDGTQQCSLTIDDLRAVPWQDYDAPENSLQIFNGESSINNLQPGHSYVTYASDRYKEGFGALKSRNENQAATQVPLQFTFTPVNILDYCHGELQFWLRFDDGSAPSGNLHVELSSSGKCDEKELEWTVDASYAVADGDTGWYKVSLPFWKAGRSGQIDFTSVNHIRMYYPSGTYLNLTVDDLRVLDNTSIQISKCEEGSIEIKSTQSAHFTTEAGTYYEGNGAVKCDPHNVTPIVLGLSPSVDISANQDGALQFWLRIDDSVIYDTIHVEMSSSGTCDQQEREWEINLTNHASYTTGTWYLITLPFSSANKSGETKFEAINYFRFWYTDQNGNPPSSLAIDDIRAVR